MSLEGKITQQVLRKRRIVKGHTQSPMGLKWLLLKLS